MPFVLLIVLGYLSLALLVVLDFKFSFPRPEYQRTTATALGTGLGVLGYAVSFLLGKRAFAVATT